MRNATTALTLALLVAAGCDDGPTVPRSPSGSPAAVQSLTGYYAGAGDDGKVSLSISAAALSAPAPRAPRAGADTTQVAAYATLSRDGGGTAVLSGTYDSLADTLRLSGSGYAVRGSLAVAGPPSVFAGTFDGPAGSGAWRCLSGNAQAIAVYCGSFSSGTTTHVARWHFAAGSGVLVGTAYVAGDTTGLEVEGIASGAGAVRTLSATGGDGSRLLSVSGSLDTGTRTASGLWSIAQGGAVIDHGSWSAVPCLDGTTSGN